MTAIETTTETNGQGATKVEKCRAAARATREATQLRQRRDVQRQHVLADWLVDLVELRFDMDRGAMRKGSRRSMRMVQARHVAAYLMHVELGLSQAATARVLGRHRSTVNNSLRQVEDGRDDPVLNRHIAGLTAQMDTLREVTR